MNKLFAKVTAPAPHPVSRRAASYRMTVRDLELEALVGVYEHEHHIPQRIRVNIDVEVAERFGLTADRLAEVVSYEDFVVATREIVASGHVNLLETLADRIAERCLADRRVQTVRVRIEKLDVFPDAASVGIEIERYSA